MKRFLITLDEGLAKELKKYPNQSEVLREAFRVYNEYILTDTFGKLKAAFLVMEKRLDETNQKLDQLIDSIGERW